MNDPHVKALFYKVRVGECVDYKKASSMKDETENFIVTIDQDKVQFDLKTHCTTKEEAMSLADDYLRAWEIEIGLANFPGELSFDFNRAEIIDRAPAAKLNNNLVDGRVEIRLGCSMDAVLHISRGKYPSPPKNFIASPAVQRMYARFKEYCLGKDKVGSMAYLCLDIIEKGANSDAKSSKREQAAKKYFIDIEVLKKLGQLTSTKGSIMEARKANDDGSFVPFQANEKEWIEAVIKAIIRRVGEFEYNPNNLTQLKMNSFPPLTT